MDNITRRHTPAQNQKKDENNTKTEQTQNNIIFMYSERRASFPLIFRVLLHQQNHIKNKLSSDIRRFFVPLFTSLIFVLFV